MHSPILLLFLQILLILAVSRLLGHVFARLRQPQVIGEMLAGILLGPSLFGWLFPDAFAAMFPPGSREILGLLANLGVVVFLFLIGLDLDPVLLYSRGRAAAAISAASIALPFALGVGLALVAYDQLFEGSTRSRLASVLFMGAAMSITAFPVLARILTERNLHKSRVGVLSIAAAAVNDVFAWCILAVVVAVATHGGRPGAGLRTIGLSAAYLAFMFFLMRPFLRRLETLFQRTGRLSHNLLALVLLLLLASSAVTEWIGIHALFGAFVLGFLMPKGHDFVRALTDRLEDFILVFLLPLFFAFAGLNTQLGLLSSPGLWLTAGSIIVLATAGKIGGTVLAARLSDVPWRESAAVGILMNTRGLMELVILTIGLSLGVITPSIFAMMVLMALVTTALTTPLLDLVYPRRLLERQAQQVKAEGLSILIPVSLPKSGGPLLQLAEMLTGPKGSERPALYALHLRRPDNHEAFHPDAPDGDDPALTPLLAQARARDLSVEPISLMSQSVPEDIAAVSAARNVDLVLMGFHNPVFGRALLGGTVHKVLAGCPAHVAVFVDRGFRTAARILVPFLGGSHDRFALDLATRIAQNAGAQVTILHVIAPLSGAARNAASGLFPNPLPPNLRLQVVEDTSPVGIVLHQAQFYDLVVIGVSEEWGLESHLFGWRPERIARDCPASLLIVRHYTAPAATETRAAGGVQPVTT